MRLKAILSVSLVCVTASAFSAAGRHTMLMNRLGPSAMTLYVANGDGSGERPLFSMSGFDYNASFSPDGRWIVFASTRDRPFDETSLWIAPAGVAMPPHRLTEGKAIDSHPTWTADGRAIVFASTRAAGNFDLWRLAIDHGQPGRLVQLTSAPGHEVTPAVAADGTIIYASVTPNEQRHDIETHLEQRDPDGTIRRLSSGPADS